MLPVGAVLRRLADAEAVATYEQSEDIGQSVRVLRRRWPT
jgi:hypothetical protein